MGTTLNILIVDDDADDHLLFREALSDIPLASLHLASVNNGIEAIEHLLRNSQGENKTLPDFIVMDLNMPLMNGFETLKEIKSNKLWLGIPVYILTTSWNEPHMQTCRNLGASGYFTKPSKLSDLSASIRKMISDLKQ